MIRSILAVAALAATALAPSARAQEAGPFSGRVELKTRPVAGVPVTLHRVTADSSGALATTTTDASGAFRFDLPASTGEGFTVYFTTAEYRSVRYFGLPLHSTDPRTGYAIEVFDTASTLPGGVRISRRDLVLLPHTDGGWEVNEVVRVLNSADRTLVAGPGTAATWEISLPGDLEAFEAGEGDVPSDRMQWMGDRLFLLMPLTPGEHDIYFRYRLPASETRATLALGEGADSLNVYVAQPAPRLAVEGMTTTEMLTVEGQRFLQYAAIDLGPGSTIRFDWEGDAPPADPVAAGVAAALVLLLIGVGVSVRNRGPGRAPPRPAARVEAGAPAE